MSPPLNSKFTLNGKLADESPATCDWASVHTTDTHTHPNRHVLSITNSTTQPKQWECKKCWIIWRTVGLWTLPNQKHKHTLHAKGNSHHIQECLRRGRLLKCIILSSRTLWLRPDFIEQQIFKSFSTSSSWILLIESKEYVTTVGLSGVRVHNVFVLTSCHVESGLV